MGLKLALVKFLDENGEHRLCLCRRCRLSRKERAYKMRVYAANRRPRSAMTTSSFGHILTNCQNCLLSQEPGLANHPPGPFAVTSPDSSPCKRLHLPQIYGH